MNYARGKRRKVEIVELDYEKPDAINGITLNRATVRMKAVDPFVTGGVYRVSERKRMLNAVEKGVDGTEWRIGDDFSATGVFLVLSVT